MAANKSAIQDHLTNWPWIRAILKTLWYNNLNKDLTRSPLRYYPNDQQNDAYPLANKIILIILD